MLEKLFEKFLISTLDFSFKYDLIILTDGVHLRFSKMESQEVKQMFSYFDCLLKQLLLEKYPDIKIDCTDIEKITTKTITEEYRKFLDKVAIKIIIDMFEREEYVNAILKLARIERIIIAFNIIQGLELREIAYLLNTSADSVYSQKNTALKRLKTELKNIQ